jgi:hypothetical protein
MTRRGKAGNNVSECMREPIMKLCLLAVALLLSGCGGCDDRGPARGSAGNSTPSANSRPPAPSFDAHAAAEDLFSRIVEAAAGSDAFLRSLEGPLNAEKLNAIGWTAERVNGGGYVPADFSIEYNGRALTVSVAPKSGKGAISISRAIK